MLQSFRDNLKGTVAVFIVILLAIPFALVGVENLAGVGAGGGPATINGEDITDSKLNYFIRYEKNRLQQMYGDNLPEDFLSDERLRPSALQTLITRTLLVQSAENGGMAVSEAQIADTIRSMPAFQTNGAFDEQQFMRLIRSGAFSATTPATFKEEIADDLVMQQHNKGLLQSAFATPIAVSDYVALNEQKRSFEYATIKKAELAEGISISEAEIAAFYDNNQAQFMTQEQVSITFLELKSSDFSGSLQLNEDDILAQYEQEIASFASGVERKAAHILFEGDIEAAQEKASNVLEKLNAGEVFTVLAAEYSDDILTSETGGEIGFSKGDTFPEAMEVALAELEVGEYSDVIETENGLHIVKLLEAKELNPPTLAEKRPAIERKLQQAAANDAYMAAMDRLLDALNETDNLQEIADRLGLEVQTSELFGRQGGEGITAQNAVIGAAFSPGVLEEGMLSELLEITPEHTALLRLAEYKPSAVKPIADVSEQIEKQLLDSKARDAVIAQGRQLLTAAQASGELSAVVSESTAVETAEGVKRTDRSLDRTLVQQVFSQPSPGQSPVITGVQLSNGDYAVIQLNHVVDGSVSTMAADQVAVLRKQLQRTGANATYAMYQDYLREQADIEID